LCTTAVASNAIDFYATNSFDQYYICRMYLHV